METITIHIYKDDVYEEVAKATDYTGSKLIDGDEGARDRILAADDDLAELGRFWEESVAAVNENFKEMLVSGATKDVSLQLEPVTPVNPNYPIVLADSPSAQAISPDHTLVPLKRTAYEGVIEVSIAFDKGLTASVQSTLRSFFIASIIGQWFKFANKGEAGDYFTQAAEMLDTAERLLYSRKKPKRPTT